MFNQLINEVYGKLNLFEAIEASDKEYYLAVSKHYSKDMVQTIKQFVLRRQSNRSMFLQSLYKISASGSHSITYESRQQSSRLFSSQGNFSARF